MLCVILEGFLLKAHDGRTRWLAGSCHPPFRLLVEDQRCVWNYCSNKYSWTVHNIVEAMITHALISYGRHKESRKKEDRFYLKLPPCQWSLKIAGKKKHCWRSHNHKLLCLAELLIFFFSLQKKKNWFNIMTLIHQHWKLFCRFWYQNVPLKAIKHTQTNISISIKNSNPLIYTNFLNPAAFLFLFLSKLFWCFNKN